MSYRRSNFDPLAVTHARRPKRPYNWLQRVGVALEVAAVAWLLVFAAGEFGWFGLPEISPQPTTALALIGMLLINSRTEEGQPISQGQRRRNARWLWWLLAICVCVVAIILAVSEVR